MLVFWKLLHLNTFWVLFLFWGVIGSDVEGMLFVNLKIGDRKSLVYVPKHLFHQKNVTSPSKQPSMYAFTEGVAEIHLKTYVPMQIE